MELAFLGLKSLLAACCFMPPPLPTLMPTAHFTNFTLFKVFLGLFSDIYMYIYPYIYRCAYKHTWVYLTELMSKVSQHQLAGPQVCLVGTHTAWEIRVVMSDSRCRFCYYLLNSAQSSFFDSFHPATLPELFPMSFKAAWSRFRAEGGFFFTLAKWHPNQNTISCPLLMP